MAWGNTTGFEKREGQIEVADARGDDGYLNYDVYEFTPPSGAFEAEETKYRVYFE
jgi:hypothetical protein